MSRHAIEQARDRYGISVGEGDLALMRRAIIAGKTLLLKRQAHGCEVHAIQHEIASAVVTMLAVWRPDHLRIVTFLPLSSGGRSHAKTLGKVAVKNMGNFRGKRGQVEVRKRDRRIMEEEEEL